MKGGYFKPASGEAPLLVPLLLAHDNDLVRCSGRKRAIRYLYLCIAICKPVGKFLIATVLLLAGQSLPGWGSGAAIPFRHKFSIQTHLQMSPRVQF